MKRIATIIISVLVLSAAGLTSTASAEDLEIALVVHPSVLSDAGRHAGNKIVAHTDLQYSSVNFDESIVFTINTVYLTVDKVFEDEHGHLTILTNNFNIALEQCDGEWPVFIIEGKKKDGQAFYGTDTVRCMEP